MSEAQDKAVTFDRMPGADQLEEGANDRLDMNFGLGQDPVTEEPVEEVEEEEQDEPVAEAEEPEDEPEGEPEAEEEPVAEAEEPEQAEEVIDMTDALRYQLVRLESMQQAAKRLISLPRLGQQRFARGGSEHFENVTEPVWTANLYDLLAAYGSIQSGVENRTLTIAATRLFSVQEATQRLRNLIGRLPEWTVLESFLPPNLKTDLDRRSATASHFVASLELAREGMIRLRQESRFAPLFLRSRDQA